MPGACGLTRQDFARLPGVPSVIRVVPAGTTTKTRPFEPVTRRSRNGSAFGGACVRTGPSITGGWSTARKIGIDPMITHILSLGAINKGFDPMHAGQKIRSVEVS